ERDDVGWRGGKGEVDVGRRVSIAVEHTHDDQSQGGIEGKPKRLGKALRGHESNQPDGRLADERIVRRRAIEVKSIGNRGGRQKCDEDVVSAAWKVDIDVRLGRWREASST